MLSASMKNSLAAELAAAWARFNTPRDSSNVDNDPDMLAAMAPLCIYTSIDA
jgi:hypothetical protein